MTDESGYAGRLAAIKRRDEASLSADGVVTAEARTIMATATVTSLRGAAVATA